MIKFNVWLDDIRPKPNEFQVWAKTADKAIFYLKQGNIGWISLDHDLGDDPNSGSGYDVAKWIEEHAFKGELNPLKVTVHSANPVGAKMMRQAISNAELFWKKRKKEKREDKKKNAASDVAEWDFYKDMISKKIEPVCFIVEPNGFSALGFSDGSVLETGVHFGSTKEGTERIIKSQFAQVGNSWVYPPEAIKYIDESTGIMKTNENKLATDETGPMNAQQLINQLQKVQNKDKKVTTAPVHNGERCYTTCNNFKDVTEYDDQICIWRNARIKVALTLIAEKINTDELRFSSEDNALHYLENLVGKKITVKKS